MIANALRSIDLMMTLTEVHSTGMKTGTDAHAMTAGTLRKTEIHPRIRIVRMTTGAIKLTTRLAGGAPNVKRTTGAEEVKEEGIGEP
jgi:hypothetical protein